MRMAIAFLLLLVPVWSYADNFPVTNKKVAKSYVKKIRKLQSEGRKMELLRSSFSPSDHYACMEKMRHFQPLASKLEAEGEAFPMTSANLSFRGAATQLKLCVSCSSIASEYCELVDKSIQDGFKYLREE